MTDDDLIQFNLRGASAAHFLKHWERILILTMADGPRIEPVITLAGTGEEPSTAYPRDPAVPLRGGTRSW